MENELLESTVLQSGTDGIIELTADNFDRKIAEAGADRPVVVDFYAPWCGPCKRLAPVIEKFGAEHSDRVTVARINIDNADELTERFRIQSIPTVAVFRDGEITRRAVGVSTTRELEDIAFGG